MVIKREPYDVIRFPNEMLEKLSFMELYRTAIKVVIFIYHQCYVDGTVSESRSLSMDEIADQVRASSRSVKRALDWLIDRNLVFGETPTGASTTSEYRFNLDINTWESSHV